MIQEINSENDLREALSQAYLVMDAEKGDPDFPELVRLTALIEEYEDIHHPLDPVP